MTTIVGIRFRGSGKIYYFNPNGFEIKAGTNVIVETARGLEYGTAASGPRQVHDESISQPLKNVVRIATDEDTVRVEQNREKEREALAVCKEKIRKHELDMKLIDAEYAFDNSKILFYFTADGRVDFRELVKDLASVFRTRIELRQIGVRDETKILGGIGICGRPLCCSTWLSDFVPVSIRMAKEQNLSLNPTKISGTCGRLMCCLKNEQSTYEYLNSQLPSVGEKVTTITGLEGEVASVSVLRQRVRVLVNADDEKEIQEYDVSELQFTPRNRKEKRKGNEKGERREKGERTEKSERVERPENKERSGHKEKGERKERAERGEKGDRREKQERREKPEYKEKGEISGKEERSEKSGQGERQKRVQNEKKRNQREEKPADE